MSSHSSELLQRGRILIADDDVALLKPTAELLSRHGYHVDCATDADGVRSLLRATEYDLLISDICMPGNHGLELIRELPHLATSLPVILLTGRPTVQTAVEAVRFAIVAYLLKPPRFDEMMKLVDETIAQRRTWRIVRSSRQRLAEWLEELQNLEARLQKPAPVSAASLMIASVDLTLQHALSALSEVKLLTDALSDAETHADNLSTAALVRATRETVQVLLRTRQSFKSKELADLRRRLEELLATIDGAANQATPPGSDPAMHSSDGVMGSGAGPGGRARFRSPWTDPDAAESLLAVHRLVPAKVRQEPTDTDSNEFTTRL